MKKNIFSYKRFFIQSKIFSIGIIGLLIGILSCNSAEESTDISFYYWKTIFKLSENENLALKENHVKNIYIRYFDIDINPNNQKPIPLSPIVYKQKIGNLRVIPVVYIKNKVLLQKNADIEDLAKKTFSYIQQINKQAGITCDEIQIDCDWTMESRNNYLKFIEIFKAISKMRLSATIRLHQIKYYLQTKIPNVDRGVLMYYNMGSIAADTLNSIYEKENAEKYLSSLKNYPLDLDVALPIYSWGVHIRNKRVINLINKANEISFSNDTNFIIQDNHFVLVKNSTIKYGYYFKENDKIKPEIISFNDLNEMANDLSQNLKHKPKEIIFYDLDSSNLNRYRDESQIFKKIINHF